ncbi:MAG: mechanosensitive ion channel [Fibrobacterales bacterium]|nr:mechanosensitive ion channel [Fibrobacterales bacterium]
MDSTTVTDTAAAVAGVAVPMEADLTKWQEFLWTALEKLAPIALRVVAAFIVAMILRKVALGLLDKFMAKRNFDAVQAQFFHSVLNAVMWIVVLLAVLTQCGFDTTSLIAIFGTAGLAIGLALKDSIQNFASGVMLILFHPFGAGDKIDVAGSSGTVLSVDVFATRVKTDDGNTVIIPNGKVFGSVIVLHPKA